MDPLEFVITSFASKSALEGTLGVVRDIFLLLDLALIVFFIFTLQRAMSVRPNFTLSVRMSRKTLGSMKDLKITAQWQELINTISGDSPKLRIVAINTADKIVDSVLSRLGIKGEHIADRIERLHSGGFTTLDRLWHAHKTCNEIARNPGLEISHADAVATLASYEAFLKELGVL